MYLTHMSPHWCPPHDWYEAIARSEGVNLAYDGSKLRSSESLRQRLARYWPAYVLLIPVIAWYLVFCYLPMGGLVIAFKKFSAIRGIGASPWVGWENFERLFASAAFLQSVKNTIVISALNLLIGFPTADHLRGAAQRDHLHAV